jgi:hypothetical protein
LERPARKERYFDTPKNDPPFVYLDEDSFAGESGTYALLAEAIIRFTRWLVFNKMVSQQGPL